MRLSCDKGGNGVPPSFRAWFAAVSVRMVDKESDMEGAALGLLRKTESTDQSRSGTIDPGSDVRFLELGLVPALPRSAARIRFRCIA